MKSLLSSLWVVLMVVTPVTGLAAGVSQNTHYTDEVLSAVPYRIKYVLTGKTTRTPEYLPALALDGQFAFVFALADKRVPVPSDGLYIDSPTAYALHYRPNVNTDRRTRSAQSRTGGPPGMHSTSPAVKVRVSTWPTSLPWSRSRGSPNHP